MNVKALEALEERIRVALVNQEISGKPLSAESLADIQRYETTIKR